jgi:GNAT superfamily N-acetyltransferase
MSGAFEVRRIGFTDSEVAETSAFLRSVFPHAKHLTPAYLRWQYAQNPAGRAFGFEARRDGRLIAHFAALPMIAAIDGDSRPGALVVNGAVDPAHGGRKVAKETMARLYTEAPDNGFDFLVAVGNANSTGPLLNRWRLVGQLEARIGLGRPPRLDDARPPSFERLWTDDAIAWRLADPERRSRIRKRGGGAVEVIVPSGRPGIAAILYDGLDRWALARGAERKRAAAPLRLWIGLDPALDWSRSRFFPIPRLLRRSPLNLVFKDVSGCSLFPDPARVIFRAIDFDAF